MILAYKRTRGVRIAFLGIDTDDLPVFQVQDQVRTTEPFAIHLEVGPPAVSKPVGKLRWFVDAELDVIDVQHHELLSALPTAL